MNTIPSILIPLIKVNPLLVVPWIVFSIPAITVAQQQLPLIIVFAGIGVTGTLFRQRTIISLGYALLVLLLVWGKAVGDVLSIPGPDTALFLFQFVAVLFFYEVSDVMLVFESHYRIVKDRNDEFSDSTRQHILAWCRNQFLALGRMTLAALGLSLGLLVLGAFASVAVNQLAFAAILVVGSVIVLLFLLTNRREPRAAK